MLDISRQATCDLALNMASVTFDSSSEILSHSLKIKVVLFQCGALPFLELCSS